MIDIKLAMSLFALLIAVLAFIIAVVVNRIRLPPDIKSKSFDDKMWNKSPPPPSYNFRQRRQRQPKPGFGTNLNRKN